MRNASGQWWKAWVLLTALGSTLLGWMAFTTSEPKPEPVTVSSETPPPTRLAPPIVGRRLDEPRPFASGVSTRPAMPQKPIFQAPVTRTRRS